MSPTSQLLFSLVAAAVLISHARSCTVDETCTFNKPEKHKQNASVGEYTSYITRKSSCVLIVLKANKQRIDTIGQNSTGHAQFLYTPNILQNEPYPTKQAIIYNSSCPAGQRAYFDLLELDLEPDECVDYLSINMPTPHHVIGNNITASGTPLIGDISHLLFRSDQSNRNGRTGFKGYLQCFKPNTANMEGCTGGTKRRNVKSYLPGGRDQGDLRMLRKAAFDAVVSVPKKNLTDDDLELALKHEKSCNAVLRALALAVIDFSDKYHPGRVSSLRPSSNKVLKPPTTSTGRCISTAANFPKCARIGYVSTFLPNFEQESDNVSQIVQHMSLFNSLIYEARCSNASFHLVCLVYAPVCVNNQTRYKVCRGLCEYVKRGCTSYLSDLAPLPLLQCNNDDIYCDNTNDYRCVCPADFAALQIPDDSAVATEAPPTEITVTAKGNDLRRPPDDESHCVTMTEDFPFCYNMPWENVTFPNWRKQKTQRAAAAEIVEFRYDDLVRTQCHPQIRHLICSYYAPICPNVNRISLLPCRDWCEKISKRCATYILAQGVPLPEFLQCSTFPEQPCFSVPPGV